MQERNNGVFWEELLSPCILDEAAVEASRIRRYKDKIRLPPDVGDYLMAQVCLVNIDFLVL